MASPALHLKCEEGQTRDKRNCVLSYVYYVHYRSFRNSSRLDRNKENSSKTQVSRSTKMIL
jgi:hypothetical protein